jgi:opacity protein-like surface antigen
MKRFILSAVLCIVAAPAALAADSGFYSGTSIGGTSVSNPTAFSLTKSSDFVFGGFIGYRLNPNLGFEGAYTGIGRFRNATQSGKADALSLDVVGFWPIANKFELVGKLGVADAFGKSAKGGLSNAHRVAATYGVGLQFNPTESIGIRVGIDRFAAAVKEATATHDYNSDVFGATFVYRF